MTGFEREPAGAIHRGVDAENPTAYPLWNACTVHRRHAAGPVPQDVKRTALSDLVTDLVTEMVRKTRNLATGMVF